MDSPTTLDEKDPDSSSARPSTEALALVIAWCADAPWRAGEIAWLPPGLPGGPRVLGRGERLADDPYPRLAFVRQRPRPEATEPLSLPTISRVQLIVSARGLEGVAIRNLGRCPLFIGGKQVDDATLVPGQAAQLGHQLLLICVRRVAALPAPPEEYPMGEFGAADGLGIVGESVAIWKLRQELGMVGPRSGHVLLLGPSGAGKELSAHGIHALSARGRRAIIARNAATIPESLIDAELFGNARNYPNPGMAERCGLVGEADESTLFLDEIAELPFTLQGHLLRVLDGGEYHRLGESMSRRSNLRLVAATNRPVSQLKEDLLARFTYRIEVPDLNVRREDIPLLVQHILRRLAQTDPKLAPSMGGKTAFAPAQLPIGLCRRLLEHGYTSHLRELERLILQAFIECGNRPAHAAADEPRIVAGNGSGNGSPPIAPAAVGDSEKSRSPSPERIQAVLDEHNGSIETAYRALGLKNRFVLGRLIAKHGLEVRRRRSLRQEREKPEPSKG